jgi:hypothetical protein
MSIASFKEFVRTIDPESQGFTEFAKSVSSAPDLVAYAHQHGIELSTEEATDVIESGKWEMEAAGGGPLSEDALEKVTGGIALDVITYLGRIATGIVSSGLVATPPFLGGTVTGVMNPPLTPINGTIVDPTKGD